MRTLMDIRVKRKIEERKAQDKEMNKGISKHKSKY